MDPEVKPWSNRKRWARAEGLDKLQCAYRRSMNVAPLQFDVVSFCDPKRFPLDPKRPRPDLRNL